MKAGFYGDKSLDILGGAIQTAVGIFSYRIGKTIGSHGMKTSGAISMAMVEVVYIKVFLILRMS